MFWDGKYHFLGGNLEHTVGFKIKLEAQSTPLTRGLEFYPRHLPEKLKLSWQGNAVIFANSCS